MTLSLPYGINFLDCCHQSVAEVTAELMFYNCDEQSGEAASLSAGIKLQQNLIWTATAACMIGS